jgi:hypothetical protein
MPFKTLSGEREGHCSIKVCSQLTCFRVYWRSYRDWLRNSIWRILKWYTWPLAFSCSFWLERYLMCFENVWYVKRNSYKYTSLLCSPTKFGNILFLLCFLILNDPDKDWEHIVFTRFLIIRLFRVPSEDSCYYLSYYYFLSFNKFLPIVFSIKAQRIFLKLSEKKLFFLFVWKLTSCHEFRLISVFKMTFCPQVFS